jgi:hypothetical protein
MHAVVDKENLSCEEEEEIDKNEKEETLENGDSQFEVVPDQEGSGFSKLVDKSAIYINLLNYFFFNLPR